MLHHSQSRVSLDPYYQSSISQQSQHAAQRQQSGNESQMEVKIGEVEYRQQICDDRAYCEKLL